MKSIKEVSYLENVKVILATDFNVPIKDGKVNDEYRLIKNIETIRYLVQRKAKILILSHVQSPEGDNLSLEPICYYLKEKGFNIRFEKKPRNIAPIIESMSGGECVLLENIRTFKGETENDTVFAKELASLGDIYVNESFSVSHRKHASIIGIPKYIPGYMGLQFEREVAELSKMFKPDHPFLFILGGAKFSTKMPLVSKFLNLSDDIYIGGALANNILKARGNNIGKSTYDDKAIVDDIATNPKIHIPSDIVTQNKINKLIDEINNEDQILDIGHDSESDVHRLISASKMILWNGPMGKYESGYTESTLNVATWIAQATEKGAVSVLGGGDTLSAIQKLGLLEKYTFVSTGGGAMLQFLADGTLPGIEALK
jgi:3-phosphoglycerate kinase